MPRQARPPKGLRSFKLYGAPWFEATGRKAHRCELCRENTIKKGERLWRPCTSGYNRMCRICSACGDRKYKEAIGED